MTTVNATDVIDGTKNQHEINSVTLAHGYAHWRDLREFGNVLADQTTDHTTIILYALSQLSEGEALYIPRNVKWNATSYPNALSVYNALKDNCVLIDDSGYENRYNLKYWQASQQIYYKTKVYGGTGRANGNGLNVRSEYHPYYNLENDAGVGTGGCRSSISFRFNDTSLGKDDFQFSADRTSTTNANIGISTYGPIVNGTRALAMGGQTSVAPHCFAFNTSILTGHSFIFGKAIRSSMDTDEQHKLKEHKVRWSQPLDHEGNFEQTWVARKTTNQSTGTTENVQIHSQVIVFSSGDLIWTLKDGTNIALSSLIQQNKGRNLTKNIIKPITTYSLGSGESGSYISNVNATGGYIVNLPKAVQGLYFEFSVDSLNNLRVQPNAADNFISLATGKYKQSNTVGSRLRVTAVTDNIWSVEQIGTWTDQV